MNCARNCGNLLNFVKVIAKTLLVPFFSGHGVEGAQRVHISAKYTIMLWRTRLHVYISTSLCTCAVDASPANDNDVIDNDGCGVTGMCGKIHLERCWHFCTFLHNPHFDFEPDYVIRKPRKWGFQRYIVRMEIFSTFHARVEYISVKTVIGQIDLPTRCSDDAAVYL